MSHPPNIFTQEVYKKIFSTFFPTLAEIPHADSLSPKKSQRRRLANCTKQWARNLVPVMFSKQRLTLLDKNWCFPRTLAGMAGFRRYEGTIYNFQRLNLLEEQTRNAGLNFDWEQI